MEKRLLLIYEDKNELDAFKNALGNIPGIFDCEYAANAKDALTILRLLKPDFIFSDYKNSANGLQLLSVIKNEHRFKFTKVFIYSEMITEEVEKLARILGASGCIEKTESIGTLTHQFRAIFAGDLMPAYSFLPRTQTS